MTNRFFLRYALCGMVLALFLLEAGAARAANPPAAAADIVALDSQHRAKWQIRSGEWVFGENGLQGSGDSAMEFVGPFQTPFTLRFRLTVLSGKRPRIKVGPVTLANEGEQRIFQVTSHAARFPYKLKQEYQVMMEVRTDGMDVSFDGQKQLSVTAAMGLIPEITFRSGDYYSKGVSRFADIVIHPSQPPANSGIAAADPAKSSPSVIEILSEQAPNALEWALAPLDQKTPPDIRQNLTFLREDLLDEAAKKPTAGADAYKLGQQLCDDLLATLDERDKALVHAGYTGAQAKANIVVDSQALEARRNYKMSWPQYKREQDQRHEIQKEQDAHAALMKERPAVDWADRGVQIRKIVETRYAQYREAARRSPNPKE